MQVACRRGDGMKEIEVHMGHWQVPERPVTLSAPGVGSCLAVTLYDRKRRTGGLAHAMLPCRDGASNERANDARYVDVAIHEMVQRMLGHGSQREDIEAKIVGGANMFTGLEHDIGSENVSSARAALKRENITLVTECVGGTNGRSVEFSPASGVVTVKLKL